MPRGPSGDVTAAGLRSPPCLVQNSLPVGGDARPWGRGLDFMSPSPESRPLSQKGAVGSRAKWTFLRASHPSPTSRKRPEAAWPGTRDSAMRREPLPAPAWLGFSIVTVSPLLCGADRGGMIARAETDLFQYPREDRGGAPSKIQGDRIAGRRHQALRAHSCRPGQSRWPCCVRRGQGPPVSSRLVPQMVGRSSGRQISGQGHSRPARS